MNKLIYGLWLSLGAFTLISITHYTYAQVNNSVNVSNNGSGSTSNVQIHNSVNASNTSSSTNNTSTHIRIETNGQVKEYDSSQPGDVNIQSDDGTSQVHVNNIIGPSQTDTGEPTSTITLTPSNNNSPSITPPQKHSLLTPSMPKSTQKPFNFFDFLHNLFSFKWFGG